MTTDTGNTMEELLKHLGFVDRMEMIKLVSSIDISTPEKLIAFKEWQENDGTKEGLLKLKEKNNA